MTVIRQAGQSGVNRDTMALVDKFLDRQSPHNAAEAADDFVCRLCFIISTPPPGR